MKYCVFRADSSCFLDFVGMYESSDAGAAVRKAAKKRRALKGNELCALPASACLLYDTDGQPQRDFITTS